MCQCQIVKINKNESRLYSACVYQVYRVWDVENWTNKESATEKVHLSEIECNNETNRWTAIRFMSLLLFIIEDTTVSILPSGHRSVRVSLVEIFSFLTDYITTKRIHTYIYICILWNGRRPLVGIIQHRLDPCLWVIGIKTNRHDNYDIDKLSFRKSDWKLLNVFILYIFKSKL